MSRKSFSSFGAKSKEDVKPEPKSEPEVKSEVKSEVKPEAKSEPKPQPEPRSKRYFVAQGIAITTYRGLKANGAEIKAVDLAPVPEKCGERELERLDELVKLGRVEKR